MKSSAEFECECGVKTIFDFEKAEQFRPTLTKVACRDCKSLWEIRMRYHPDGQLSAFRIIQPSQKLYDLVLKKKVDQLKNAPQKKSPQWVVPHMKKIIVP